MAGKLIVNGCQWLSMTGELVVNDCEWLSMVVNGWRIHLLIIVNHCQSLAVTQMWLLMVVNGCQSLTIIVNACIVTTYSNEN